MSSAIYRPPGTFKLLRYHDESDISSAAKHKNSKLNPGAIPFVPSTVAQQTLLPISDEGSSDEGSVEDEPLNQAIPHIEVGPIDPSIHTTEKDVDAAKVFQRWYRRRLAVKSMARTRISQIREMLYTNSLSEINKLDVSRQYCYMFLGPLPHVLTALKGCDSIIQKTKRQCNKRLLNPKSTDLERLVEFVTICKYVQVI